MNNGSGLTYDPLQEVLELREQLASDRRQIAFLFGAGTSQSVGIDGVAPLTRKIQTDLEGSEKVHYERILKDLGADATVEGVLDEVRLCRELIGTSTVREAGGLKGKEAEILDRAICRSIYKRVAVEPPGGYSPLSNFAQWVGSVSWEYPVEVFTTNYDLLIERALESARIPHCDGFVGSVLPFFDSGTVESDWGKDTECPPRQWVRVWKMHGSIGWRVVKDPVSANHRICRVANTALAPDEDLVIFPSRTKYSDSRKLPFLSYHDRFRKLLSGGAALLVVAGYSFSDQHINEIIFQSLRSNNRLAVTVLSFDALAKPEISRKLLEPTAGLRNLTVYGPDQARISGSLRCWHDPTKKPHNLFDLACVWDSDKKTLRLGDFKCLGDFLKIYMGTRASVDARLVPGKADV